MILALLMEAEIGKVAQNSRFLATNLKI